MGTATVQTQHAAERLGLPLEQVRFEYGDTSLPGGRGRRLVADGSDRRGRAPRPATSSSRQLLKLAQQHADSPLAKAQPGTRCKPRRTALSAGTIRRRGESYASILQRAGQASRRAPRSRPARPMETMKYSMHSYGAQFCEVRVNEVTGEVAGSALARLVRQRPHPQSRRRPPASSAAASSWGIGMALTEETLFDERSGRIMNPSLAEYHVPVHLDVPEIDVIWTDIPDPHTPLGAHGIGEIGITGVGGRGRQRGL